MSGREAAGENREGHKPEQMQSQLHEAVLRPEQFQAGADRNAGRDQRTQTQHTIGDTVATLLEKNDPMTPARLKLLLNVVQLDREHSAATGAPSAIGPEMKQAIQAKLEKEAGRYQDVNSQRTFLRAAQLIA